MQYLKKNKTKLWKCTQLGNHYQDRDYFPHVKSSFMLLCGGSLLPPPTLASTDLFSVPAALFFPKFHIPEVIQYVAVSVWLFSFSIMLLRVFHVVACISFFFLTSLLEYNCFTMVC